MVNQDLVSIIVPIYKVETFLPRCLQSILEQSYSKIQIILVDDGSPDRCPQICDEYANIDNRIEVIHKENGGLSDARNVGLSKAMGQWIAFVDSDDLINPYYVEHLLKAASSTDSDISVCSFENFKDSVQKNTPEYKEPTVISGITMLEHIYSESHSEYVESIVAWNKLYKRDLFRNIRFPKGKIHEDEATTYKLFYKAAKVAILNESLYYYYQNDEGIMKRKFNVHRLDYIDALNERYYFYKNNCLDLLATKTAEKIYIYMVDYASLPKEDIDDYTGFRTALRKQYRKVWPILVKNKFPVKDKFRIWGAYICMDFLTMKLS